MKEFNFWQVDSFADQAFKGNPAAVFLLEDEIEDSLMQNIAAEMNLSETAFINLRQGQNPFLRWFTPVSEIDLCGHATLAAAQIYFSEFDKNTQKVIFDTKFVGSLEVIKNASELTMDFPLRKGAKVGLSAIPDYVFSSLSEIKPIKAFQSRDLMLVYESEKTVKDMTPNFHALLNYDNFIIVTAKSDDPKYHFISRFFCAIDGIAEDPVTGSAHCTLAPYWAEQLSCTELIAYQASKRGGVLKLEIQKNRLLITGKAVTIINGKMGIE